MSNNKPIIIIARHGETDDNVNRVFQTNRTPLNQVGISQAANLGKELSSYNIKSIIASDHLRTIQTADLVREILGLTEIVTSPLFSERNTGHYRGMAIEEVYSKYPESLYIDCIGKRCLNPNIRPPDGESWNDLRERAKLAVAYIETFTENTLIVTHGLMIRAIRSVIHDIPDFDETIAKFPKTKNTDYFIL